jgi:hypothetical protein
MGTETGKKNGFTGPCHVTRFIGGWCDACGRYQDALHIPMKQHGWFCEACCPVCGPGRRGNSGATPGVAEHSLTGSCLSYIPFD